MLENTRRQGASIFVYLIFCLLIAIFVINFGPQGGSKGGCNSSSNVILGVNGQESSQSAYHIAYANPYNRGNGKQKTYVALETLIRRELLAQAAEAQGLRVSTDLVQEEIKKGYFFLGGQRTQIPGIFDGDVWKLNVFTNWYRAMNVSRASYVGEQSRSMLASMMSQILQDSVQVSRDEALQHYLFENNTVQYDVVAFRPDPYKAAMKLSDADVERYLASHAKDVEDRYKADERTYKGVKPQVQLRQIFIAKAAEPAAPAPAPAEGSAAGSAAPAPKAEDKKDDKKTDKPAGMSIADAQKKLETARADIAAGKLKFADAAKQLNTDEAAKNSAGDLGWRTADNAMLGDKAITDAVKALKPGEMTPVITTDRGAYLLTAEAKREGDLAYEQVKHEIAKELARDTWAKEAAKRAALAALDKARSGTGTNLGQMFEKDEEPAAPGGIDIQQLLNDPNIPEDQKKQILEMLMKQGGKSGANWTWESDDVPAAWYAQADGTPGSAAAAGSATATAAGSATGSATATATGSATATATGSAAAPAAGSAAPAGSTGAAAVVPPAAPVSTEIVASTDTLPAFDTVAPPHVNRFGPAPRSGTMSGIGSNKDAIAALFDVLSPGGIASRVYEADGGFVLVQLISRQSPKVEDFEKESDRLVEELRQQRAQQFVETWLKDRCEKLLEAKKIKPNPQLVQEFDDNGKPKPLAYRPCMSFR